MAMIEELSSLLEKKASISTMHFIQYSAPPGERTPTRPPLGQKNVPKEDRILSHPSLINLASKFFMLENDMLSAIITAS